MNNETGGISPLSQRILHLIFCLSLSQKDMEYMLPMESETPFNATGHANATLPKTKSCYFR